MSEYEMLRNEILENYDAIKQYNLALYVAVVSVLTFALDRGNFLYSLIPYIAIIPLYFACESKNRNICKMAAYMFVFLEGKDYTWERQHQKYDELFNRKRNWKSISSYYFLSTVCSMMSIIKVFLSNYDTCKKLIFATLVLIFTIVVIVIMRLNTVNYVNCRKTMIENWETIKKLSD